MFKNSIFETIISSISVIISFSFFFGIFLGYFISKLYIDKLLGKKIGKVRFGSIYINLGKHRIHFHHWIYPFFILGVGSLTNAFFLNFNSVIGFLIGISLHDFLNDKKWYKILVHKNELN